MARGKPLRLDGKKREYISANTTRVVLRKPEFGELFSNKRVFWTHQVNRKNIRYSCREVAHIVSAFSETAIHIMVCARKPYLKTVKLDDLLVTTNEAQNYVIRHSIKIGHQLPSVGIDGKRSIN
jgi:hypothetical protein